jgi:hypothetical protein
MEPTIDPGVINDLFTMFGWGGGVAGVVVVVLTMLRATLLADVWDSWPRWLRFTVGFLAAAIPAGVATLVSSGGVWALAFTAAVAAGFAGVGGNQAIKTLMKPKARPRPSIGRDQSLKVPIKQPE